MIAKPKLHFVWIAYTKMYCVQANCDGFHHYYRAA